MNDDISCVDLFCGAGGLTHGFILEGLPVNAGIDLDPACRYPYEKNNDAAFIEQDVAKMGVDEVAHSSLQVRFGSWQDALLANRFRLIVSGMTLNRIVSGAYSMNLVDWWEVFGRTSSRWRTFLQWGDMGSSMTLWPNWWDMDTTHGSMWSNVLSTVFHRPEEGWSY